VIDDLADPFDYKNKYAIIQYLKEMADHTNFELVLLPHNFDFSNSEQPTSELDRIFIDTFRGFENEASGTPT